MNLIVLDTNFLIYCAKYKVDFETEIDRICDFKYKIVLPKQVVNELNELSKNAIKSKDREAASLALQIIKNFEIKKIDAKNADEAILKLKANVLATMDKELRKRFKNDRKGKLLLIRQKKYLNLI
ncbi:MAG: ribonuclease VapC [Nanoarchaeota archaeon]|nr:ribonuclease VapC [Nanoarchaeota archaeon]